MDGNKNFAIEFMRAISCIFVIIIHVTGNIPYGFENDWYLSVVMNSISRIAVPVFIIISAFLMAHKYNSYLEFIKKRIIKIIPAIIFWSYFYGLVNNKNIFSTSFALDVISGPTMFHLWYLYAIVGVYLLIPLISSFNESYGKEGVLALFLIWFAFGSLLPWVSVIFDFNIPIATSYNISQITGIAGYAIVGVGLRHMDNIRIKTYQYLISFILATTATALLTISNSKLSGFTYQEFYSYTSPLVAISAISFFCIVFKCYKTKVQTRTSKFINLISSVSLGIYCIHMFIYSRLSLVYTTHIHNENNSYIWYLILIPLLTLVISLFICLFLRKTPVIKYLV
jgi:surface polysaccharide O-acyltransferase-like enzyme